MAQHKFARAVANRQIGIAMGAAGSEVAIHSATIALMNNDLRRLMTRTFTSFKTGL